jgi:glycosyltransferase involved in cell wall biosynthesis
MIFLLHDLALSSAGGHHQYANYLLCTLRRNYQVRFSFEGLRNKSPKSQYSLPCWAVCLIYEASWLIAHNPRLIIINGLWKPEVVLLAILSLVLGKRLVVFPHGMAYTISKDTTMLSFFIRRLRHAYLYLLFRFSSHIIASSEAEAYSLSLCSCVSGKIIALPPSALYYPSAKASHSRPSSISAQFIARKSQFNILCSGRHTIAKGSDFLRALWEKYASISHVPTSLFVLGPLGDCSKFLSSMEDNSEIHTVVVNDSSYHLDDLRILAQYSDISISPSPSESFGMSIYEALAFGLPVIASWGTPWPNLNAYKAGAWVNWDILSYLEMMLYFSKLPKSDLRYHSLNSRRLALDTHHSGLNSLRDFFSLL